jgi:hypothetical protein
MARISVASTAVPASRVGQDVHPGVHHRQRPMLVADDADRPAGAAGRRWTTPAPAGGAASTDSVSDVKAMPTCRVRHAAMKMRSRAARRLDDGLRRLVADMARSRARPASAAAWPWPAVARLAEIGDS